MAEIVQLRIPTPYNIDIYSIVRIAQFVLYRKVLQESNFTFVVPLSDNLTFDIKDVAEMLVPLPLTFPDDFSINSSDNFHLFEMINQQYFTAVGQPITEHSLFVKSNDLLNRVRITQNHINGIY